MRVWFAGGGTGGHLYPAIGIARALIRVRPDVRPLFIGARRGIEREILPATEFDHLLLDLHPLYRSQPWRNWRTISGASRAWRSLRNAARAEPPVAVVGTGGYAAGVALGYAARCGLPIALQEQNSHPGLTTRFFSRYARQIHLGFPEAAQSLRSGRGAIVRDSGNPIDPPAIVRNAANREAAIKSWGFPDASAPVLLIFGGSQGARAINATVHEWVRRSLPPGLQLLWITGRAEFDAYVAAESERVKVHAFVSPMASAYAAADLAVARAGAMSTAELCAWEIPAVLVPLPTAAADHQTANARALERAGAAIVIPQAELNSSRLGEATTALLRDTDRLSTMSRAARARARPHAAEEIARDIATLLPKPNAR